MSEPKRCGNCRHFQPHDAEPDYDTGQAWHGDCVANPPVPRPEPDAFAVFPWVTEYMRCGKWTPAAVTGIDDTAKQLAEFVLLGDMTAARALADRVNEIAQGLT